jgi:type 2 lantibiotic biosynthesis protein LanM
VLPEAGLLINWASFKRDALPVKHWANLGMNDDLLKAFSLDELNLCGGLRLHYDASNFTGVRAHLTESDEEFLARVARSCWQRSEKRLVLHPRWASRARWVMERLENVSFIQERSFIGSDTPFSDVIKPIADLSIEKLRIALVKRMDVTEVVSTEAMNEVTSQLFALCSRLISPVLYLEFSKFREKSAHGELAYERFVDSFSKEIFPTLLEEYPVTWRLLSVSCNQWLVSHLELLRRFHRDADCIVDVLAERDPRAKKIQSISAGLGDPHFSGRSVRAITLDGGRTIVYKPRPTSIDASWQSFIQFINDSGSPVELRVPMVVNRNNYGWTQFIDFKPCVTHEEAHQFYKRIGAWICLFHLFSVTDIHEENIIACGADPIPIDLEISLQPHENLKKDHIGAFLRNTSLELAERQVSDTVLVSGLLPSYGKNADRETYYSAGLSSTETVEERVEWSAVNSFAMRPRRVSSLVRTEVNVPSLNNQKLRFVDYIDDILLGYRHMAEYIQDKRFEVGFKKAVRSFSSCKVRTLFKPTRFYVQLVAAACDHRRHSSGNYWGVELRYSDKFVAWNSELEEAHIAIAGYEYESIKNLSVPSFWFSADERSLFLGMRQLDNFFDRPPYESIVQRIDAFDLQCAQEQEKIISLVLNYHLDATISRNGTSDRSQDAHFYPPKTKAAAKEVIVKTSNAVVKALIANAITHEQTASWIGFDWLGDTEIPQLAPLGFDLYNGASGIALFLGIYGKWRDDPIAAALAEAALRPIEMIAMSSALPAFCRKIGLGFGTGIGGIIYACNAFSCITGEVRYRDLAERLANSIDLREIQSDDALDFLGGAAGLIPILVKLYKQTNQHRHLKVAEALADRLYAIALRDGGVQKMWVPNGMGGIPLAGLSHGASGFALAFGSLASVTASNRHLKWMEHCIEFERDLFASSLGMWPDLRPFVGGSGDEVPCQWCHGATGIGFARLALYDCWGFRHPQILDDIQSAVKLVTDAWPYPVDTVCCGGAGNALFLREYARIFRDQRVGNVAMYRFAEICRTAEADLNFKWAGYGTARHNLGLFKGVSGLGLAGMVFLDSFDASFLSAT